MYVACRKLLDDCKTIMPGEEVPNFLKWSIPVQRAHLNLEWVKNVEAVNPEAAVAEAPKRSKRRPKKEAKVSA